MKTSRIAKVILGSAAVGLMVLVAWAQQSAPNTDVGTLDKESADKAFKKPYSPYADRHYPTRVYFGDAKRFVIKMDKNIPMTAQQRAYTSPIGYTPAK